MADYIDRESLIKDFVGYCNHLSQVCHNNDDVYAEMFGIVQCLNRVESAPKADVVEVRHGEWVHNEEYEDWAEMWVCSLCNGNAPTDGDYRHNLLSHYCPNCGAKMDGKGEGE